MRGSGVTEVEACVLPRAPATAALQRDSEAFFEFNQPLEGLEKLAEGWSWKHDGVASTAHIFRDLQETASLIFLEVKKEHLPLVSHFFRSYRL